MRTFRLPVDWRRKRLPTMLARTSGAVPRSPRMARDCPTCGRTNADGKDFCDCGEYLPLAAPRACSRSPRRRPASQCPLRPPLRCRRTRRARRRHPSRPNRCCSAARPRRRTRRRPPTIPLAVATSGLLQGFVRNQTKRVDSYALRVNGLPEAWVEARRRRSTCSRTAPPATPRVALPRHDHAPAGISSRAGRHDFRLEPSRAPRRGRREHAGAIEILPTTSFSWRRFRRSGAATAGSASRRPRRRPATRRSSSNSARATARSGST